MDTRKMLSMFAGVAMLGGCSAEVGDTGGSTRRSGLSEEHDPWRPLPENEELRELTLIRRAIDLGNGLGRHVFGLAINAELDRAGVDKSYRPSGSLLEDEDVTPPATGPRCAYLEATAGPGTSISCRYLVERSRDDAFVRAITAIRDNPLGGEFTESNDPAELEGWYRRASTFGIESELVRAMEYLRAQGACDQAPTPVESSFEAGVRVGRRKMAEITRARQAMTPNTECDFDANIVEPSAAQARAEVPSIVTSDPLCPGYDPRTADDEFRFGQAQEEYRRGIERGIEEQRVLESERLFREWTCVRPVPTGGRGDPLVLDLDRNGIRVEAIHNGAVFDFCRGLVRSQWTAEGVAFVVLDRDADGQVAASELFGDVTVTEDGATARDGYQALALYDAADRGGNGDGVLDARDGIYWQLQAWTDRDGNGRVSDGELVALRDVGVRAIHLDGSGFEWTDGSRGQTASLVFDWSPVR
ncbi:MAG: hypothetical protein NZ898_07550 [Myxococcota bacterium]|nr:hypothetical protein [Myxococcota bacterium]